MNKKQQTVDTYNKSAEALTEKFNSQQPRIFDIAQAFSLVKKDNPFVLEIGCGNGRDAEEILRKTSNYLGIDISEKLIEIARKRLPAANFQVDDIETYEIPQNVDIILAFASLIHMPLDSFEIILKKSYARLNHGGIFHISLKDSPNYKEVEKTDEYGTRHYYYYNFNDINKIKGNFKIAAHRVEDIRGQRWLEITLQK